MIRASNDATPSKLGDIYQYYVALLECFKMKENEKILIEVCGDVSKISKTASFQMEVKHHIDVDFISDRDVDFWKTLRNWVKEFNRIKGFSRLILFTTSDISEKSLLTDWNKKNKAEKLKTIKDIGSVVKDKESVFRELYNEIFSTVNNDEDNLIIVLSKFQIINKQNQIAKIDEDFRAHIKHIPVHNREKFIAALLGLIVSRVKDEPHFWEITYKGFEKILQETAPSYMNTIETPLPTEYANLIPPDAIAKEHQGKVFVKAIHNIKYESEIPRAIKDYWRTNMTILKYYSNNPVFNSCLLIYKDNLENKLYHTKQSAILDNEDSDRAIQIKESKKLFSNIMAWDAAPFKSINPNQPFFQKGIIHDIVDGGDFNWDVGDKK